MSIIDHRRDIRERHDRMIDVIVRTEQAFFFAAERDETSVRLGFGCCAEKIRASSTSPPRLNVVIGAVMNLAERGASWLRRHGPE